MQDLQKEYTRLLDMQDLREEELDYSILDGHMAALSSLARLSNSGITIFDMFRRRHVFASYNFEGMLGYDLQRIEEEDSAYFNLKVHPDDRRQLFLNGIIGFRFFLEHRHDADLPFHKLISEYRINLAGKYIRVIEQMQDLEFDRRGNLWLSLCMLDISPNQAPLQRVETKLLNFRTGEVFSLPDYPEYREETISLTPREKAVLRLVREGLLSKEISEAMKISVHTVNTYRQRIIEKLDAGNSREAIRYAEKLGLLD